MSIDTLLRRAADELDTEVRASIDARAALARVEESGRGRRRVPWVGAAAAALVVVLALAAGVVATSDDDGEPVALVPAETPPDLPTTAAPPDTPPGTTPSLAPGETGGLPISATPVEGLAEGTDVVLTADDVTAPVQPVLCTADALSSGAGADACEIDPGTDPTLDLVPDTDGRVAGSLVVERMLTTTRSGTVDCADPEVRCAIGLTTRLPDEVVDGMMTSSRYGLIGLIGVGFAAQDPVADPTVTVSPATRLRHGIPVTVTGEGFVGPVGPGELCAPAVGDEVSCIPVILTPDLTTSFVETDAEGGLSVEIPVWRSFPVAMPDGTQRIVDCAVVECTLTLTGDDGRSSEPVVLAFDPTQPAPVAPTLTVSPSTGLRPGDPVDVTITGLAPDQEVNLTVCGRDCLARATLDTVVAGPDGTVSVTLPAADPAEYGAACTTAGECGLTLMGGPGHSADPMLGATVPVPLTFLP